MIHIMKSRKLKRTVDGLFTEFNAQKRISATMVAMGEPNRSFEREWERSNPFVLRNNQAVHLQASVVEYDEEDLEGCDKVSYDTLLSYTILSLIPPPSHTISYITLSLMFPPPILSLISPYPYLPPTINVIRYIN
jgi:hypothetical protein